MGPWLGLVSPSPPSVVGCWGGLGRKGLEKKPPLTGQGPQCRVPVFLSPSAPGSLNSSFYKGPTLDPEGEARPSLTFGTWAGTWVGAPVHLLAVGPPPVGLSPWVLPRRSPGNTQGLGKLLSSALSAGPLLPRMWRAASLTATPAGSPLWAAADWGAEALAQTASDRRRVVGAVA